MTLSKQTMRRTYGRPTWLLPACGDGWRRGGRRGWRQSCSGLRARINSAASRPWRNYVGTAGVWKDVTARQLTVNDTTLCPSATRDVTLRHPQPQCQHHLHHSRPGFCIHPVCLSVCLSLSRITQNVLGGFSRIWGIGRYITDKKIVD